MRPIVFAIVGCLLCASAQNASCAPLHEQLCRKLGIGYSSGYHAETCCTGCAPYSNGIRRPCYTPVYVGYGGCGPHGCGQSPIGGEYVPTPEPARAAQIYGTPLGWGRSLEMVGP